MVTVAIIGILTSVGITSYSKYIKKAKIIEVISFLDAAIPKLTLAYAKNGKFPPTIVLAGQTLTGNSSHAKPDNNSKTMTEIWYNACPTKVANICTAQIAAYVVPELGGGAISLMLIPNPDGSFRRLCGFWSTGEMGTTLQYMPSSCNNTSLFNPS